MILTYEISEVSPYINWLYFFHAWQLSGKSDEVKQQLKTEAEEQLRALEGHYRTHVVFEILDANGDGDDLLAGGVRIPMLRQQHATSEGEYNLCLADFVQPLSSGITDKVGVFAATVDSSLEHDFKKDAYQQMLVQTLADRLAEATVERMHEEVRKKWWGYAPDEHLTMEQLHQEAFQGIRPAVGYPSLPDTSVNFILSDILGMKEIGITLTQSGMMRPHASVSGFMFAHPKARYFDIGIVGEDQLRDYASRRGIPVELMRRFIK